MSSNTKNTAIFFICVGCVFYYFFYYTPHKKLECSHRYTIATISKFDFPADGGECAEILYYINNKGYNSIIGLSSEDKLHYKIGTRFFIEYYPNDPNTSALVLDKIVPDTLLNVPANGWKSIP